MPLSSNCAQLPPNAGGPHAALSRTYLPHHELASEIIITVVVIVITMQTVPACVTSTSHSFRTIANNWGFQRLFLGGLAPPLFGGLPAAAALP